MGKTKFIKFLSGITILIFILMLAFLLAGCAKEEGEAPTSTAEKKTAERINLRCAGTLPINYHVTKAVEMFKKQVEENTNGQVTIEFYPAQQLYNDKDLVNVLPKGAVDMAQVAFGMWSSLVPEVGFLGSCLLFKDLNHYIRVQDDQEALAILGEALKNKANTKLLCWLEYGGGGTVLSKQPIKNLEDFKGKRIRSFSEWSSYFLKGVGAAPVLLSSGEVYAALQRGTVDGALTGPSGVIDRKWHEVAKYLVNTYLLADGGFALVINIDSWNRIPKNNQDIILKAAQDTQKWCREVGTPLFSDTIKKIEAMPDMHVINVSNEEVERWRQVALPPQKEAYLKQTGATGQKLLDRVDALRDK